jgi:hypothetical protein
MIRKNIEIYKEYIKNTKNPDKIHFVIRTRLYNDSIQYYLDLVEIAKQDFPEKDYPDLNMKEIQAVVYGGDRFRKTRGIEFTLENVKIPKEYKEIHKLEHTLA